MHKDFFEFSSVESQLSGYDCCFYCIGRSAGLTEERYSHATYDMNLAAGQTLARLNPLTDHAGGAERMAFIWRFPPAAAEGRG